jgi:hypothetical protein
MVAVSSASPVLRPIPVAFAAPTPWASVALEEEVPRVEPMSVVFAARTARCVCGLPGFSAMPTATPE